MGITNKSLPLLDYAAPLGNRYLRRDTGNRLRARKDGRPRVNHVSSRRRGNPAWFRVACGAAALGVVIGSAHAQDAPVEQPETLIEQAQPTGTRAGRFLVYPRLSAEARYDTNLYNRDSPRTADVALVVRPAVAIDPDLARHALRLDIAGEVRRYLSTPAENSEQYFVQLSGRADLMERTAVTAHAFIARRIERRGTLGDQFLTDEPVNYVEREVGLGLARTGGRLELHADGAINRTTYGDSTSGGVPVDESFRNGIQKRGRIRLDYRFSPAFTVFGEGGASFIDYDHEPNGPRGSSSYSVLTGTRIEFSRLTNVEVAIGYLNQAFANPALPGFDGPTFSVAANWAAKPRLRIAATGKRTVERSPLRDANAVIETKFRLSATQALGGRFLAGLEGGFVADDYRGIDRVERRYTVETSLRYQINPRLSAFGAAGYRSQSGSGLGARSYDGATVRLGLRWAQ
jgi:hypothetical protein